VNRVEENEPKKTGIFTPPFQASFSAALGSLRFRSRAKHAGAVGFKNAVEWFTYNLARSVQLTLLSMRARYLAVLTAHSSNSQILCHLLDV